LNHKTADSMSPLKAATMKGSEAAVKAIGSGGTTEITELI